MAENHQLCALNPVVTYESGSSALSGNIKPSNLDPESRDNDDDVEYAYCLRPMVIVAEFCLGPRSINDPWPYLFSVSGG